MLTRLINWIKLKLLLHVPLWICGTLGFIALFLPDTPRPYALIFLLGAYFLSRYLWRKNLKKKGKLGNASSGILSLMFWASIGLFAIYRIIVPAPPELATYAENAEPIAPHEDDKRPSLKKRNKRGAIERGVAAFKAQKLACGYAKQEALLTECSETKAVEVDNNFESLEVLALSGNPMECETTNCHLWLIQMTLEQLAAYEAYNKQEEKAEPWTFQGNMIANWENVHTPIRIEHDSHNGWRKLRITHTNGQIEEWKMPNQSIHKEHKIKENALEGEI